MAIKARDSQGNEGSQSQRESDNASELHRADGYLLREDDTRRPNLYSVCKQSKGQELSTSATEVKSSDGLIKESTSIQVPAAHVAPRKG